MRQLDRPVPKRVFGTFEASGIPFDLKFTAELQQRTVATRTHIGLLKRERSVIKAYVFAKRVLAERLDILVDTNEFLVLIFGRSH
ncbi:MAG: hypothetical protein A2211_03170 [Rhodanobacter sp. RIFOXYA1_FULL_67_6]|nr:MAG: hypothetical protein A2211_03170 [Rhodanobacter sp. RIFOXYA1_FULL_67_6]